VSVAKRLLAVRAAWVWTPWQLFCHLLDAQPQVWRLVSSGEPVRGSPARSAIEA
jgi:hypothetical protein